MPTQKRLRRHVELAPPTREQPGERSQESTIGRPERRARLLPTEHDELMSQHGNSMSFANSLRGPPTSNRSAVEKAR
jgi:hypothetical protein